jgi:hypothetical protein
VTTNPHFAFLVLREVSGLLPRGCRHFALPFISVRLCHAHHAMSCHIPGPAALITLLKMWFFLSFFFSTVKMSFQSEFLGGGPKDTRNCSQRYPKKPAVWMQLSDCCQPYSFPSVFRTPSAKSLMLHASPGVPSPWPVTLLKCQGRLSSR